MLKMKLAFVIFFCSLLSQSQSLHEHLPSSNELTVSIHNHFPEDGEIIPLLEDVITNALQLFHQVTNGFILAETVRIIVPNSWTVSASEVCNDIHDLSDIRLEFHSVFGRYAGIHTTQFDQCGQPGKYITATKHFFHNGSSRVSKNHMSIKFFQQITRYKFGIYENLNPKHGNSTHIEKLQDVNCYGKNGWQILKEKLHKRHSGYKSSKNFKAPQFKLLKNAPGSAYIFLMDISENLWNKSKAWHTQSAMHLIFKNLAEDFLPVPSQLGFVTFSDRANVLRNVTNIRNKSDWNHFFHDLHIERNGTHQNLDIGLHACLKVLERQNIPRLGARIVLVTDVGWDSVHSNIFENISKEVLSQGLILHSFIVGHNSHHHQEKLQKLSKASGGQFNWISDKKHSMGHLPALLTALVPQEVFLVTREEIHIPVEQLPLEKKFYIDSSLHGRAQVILDRRSAQLGSGSFRLMGPSGEYVKPHRMKRLDTHRAVYEANQTGLWSMHISELDSGQSASNENISFSFHVKANRVPKAEEAVHLHSWLEQHKSVNMLRVFAQLTSTKKLQNVSLTAEVINHHETSSSLALMDSGLGADAIAGDGIYSGYLTVFHSKGNYEVFVKASGDKIITKPEAENESFNRCAYAGAFLHHSEHNSTDKIPPARIKDLVILNNTNQRDQITLTWTAVGDNMESGEVSAYELKVRETNKNDVTTTFSDWQRILPKNVLNGSLQPLPAASLQNVTIYLPSKLSQRKPKSIQIAIRSHDHNNNPSEISNVVIWHPEKSGQDLNDVKPKDVSNESSLSAGLSSTKSDTVFGKNTANNTEANKLDLTTQTNVVDFSKPIKSVSTNETKLSTTLTKNGKEKNGTIHTTTSKSTPPLFASTDITNSSKSVIIPIKLTVTTQSSTPITTFKIKKYMIPQNVPETTVVANSEVDNETQTVDNETLFIMNGTLTVFNETQFFLEYDHENSSIFLMAPGIPSEDEDKAAEKIRFQHINLRVSTVVAAWVGGFATTFFVMVIVAAVVKNRKKNKYNIKKSEEDFVEALALKDNSF